jgi:hypothetical protein
MTLSRERERMLRGAAAAADQQPWRCVKCHEAVSLIRHNDCRCIREARAAAKTTIKKKKKES